MQTDGFPRLSNEAIVIEAIRRTRGSRILKNAEGYISGSVCNTFDLINPWLTVAELNALLAKGDILLLARAKLIGDNDTQIACRHGLVRSVPAFHFFKLPMHDTYIFGADGILLQPGDDLPIPYIQLELVRFYVNADGVPKKIKKFLNNATYLCS